VVVCGHTDCGAVKGLLHPEPLSAMPTVKSWLRNAEAARNTAPDESAALRELIDENVVLQMSHLRTRPSVAGRLARGTLAVSGWVYDIAKGEVYVYDEQRRRFGAAQNSLEAVDRREGAAK
jgi:carbonic anhydrase